VNSYRLLHLVLIFIQSVSIFSLSLRCSERGGKRLASETKPEKTHVGLMAGIKLKPDQVFMLYLTVTDQNSSSGISVKRKNKKQMS
jgi:hypothetical protein